MSKALDDFMETAGFGELDRAEFDEKDEYQAYFDYIKFAFGAFLNHLQAEEKNNKEGKITQTVVSFFLTKLLRSIELLNLNYRFDPHHNVRIDLTESSFPNHTEIRKIKADYNLKDDFLSQMPDLLRLKDRLLEQLRTTDEEPRELLDALSKQRYYNQLYPPSIFLMYNDGKLLRNLSKAASGRDNYVYSCAVFDPPTNRPNIYILTFEYEHEKLKLEDNKELIQQLKQNVETIVQGARKLYDVMTFLDQELKQIYPKVLRKIDIGPLFGAYSKDEHVLTKFHQRNGLGNDAFALYFEEEMVISSGEAETKAKWLSSGTILQDFYIDKNNPECAERKVSSLKKKLLAPHKVIQMIYDDPECADLVAEMRNDFIPV